MKTLFTFLFLLTWLVAFTQSEFYYYHGDSIQLVEDTSKCTVEFIGEPDEAFFIQNNISFLPLTGSVYEANCNKNHVLSLGSGLVNALPQYTTNAGHKIRLSCSIVVRCKESTTAGEIDSLIQANNLSLKTDYVFFQVYETLHPLQAARSMHESGLVDFCDPNFIVENKQSSHIPDDEFFPKQWHLLNTGMLDSNGLSSTVGADINVIGGWDYSTGDPEVILAILQDPIQANHPDIPETKICRLVDANLSSDPNQYTFASNTYSHGTCVAGLVAAEMDNGIGVSGIAPSCRIMPVFGYTYSNIESSSYEFFYSLYHGARIASWSGHREVQSEFIEYSASSAIFNGLFIIRAGSNGADHSEGENADVGDTGFAEIDHVMIVGASDRNDNQADYSPTDYRIDIVAPSATDFQRYANLAPEQWPPISEEAPNIWTTDLTGDTGFADPSNPWVIDDPNSSINLGEMKPGTSMNGDHLDYTGRFFGTSAATPQVASVAALMVSANSCLTVEHIEEILFATATKIGDPLEYDALGHSNKFGYGKVNAQAAIEMALSPAYGGIDFDVEVLDRVCGPDDSGTIQINCATPSLYSAELILGYTENSVIGLGEYIDSNSAINLISEPVNFNEPIIISNLPAHLLVRITSLTEVNPYPTHNSNNILVNPWGEKPCTSTREIWLKGPQIVATLTPVICGDPDSGEALLQVEGNNNEINSYDWTVNGDAYAEVNEITLTGLSQGNLEVTITDAMGKTCANTYPISTAEDCCENIASSLLDQSPISCPNSSDGNLLLEINGPESEYTFDWTSQSTHQVIENLPQNETGIELAACGDYTLEVSDNVNLCSKTFNYTLACLDAIEVDATLTDISCYSLTDGSIALIVTGGNGGFEIDWNENIPDIFNPVALASGIYSGVITDQNGCTKNIEYTLYEPTEIVITANYIVAPSCPEAADGQLEVGVTGGSGNYLFDWINEDSENGVITGISEGAYEVQVTDDSGCSQSALFDVEAIPFNYATNHTYNNENWNGQTILFGGDLILPLGDWPTFSNVTFVFAQGAQLIIEEGAIVILENCTLTSCGANWDGIWVKSYGNGVGTGPGNLIMNGGLIRYATTGIFYPDLYVWDGPYESGNVNCTNVQFENNRTAIRVEKSNQADDDENYVGPFAFRGCTFIADDDYNNHFSQPFEQHVYMHLNTGNGFRSCSFLNNMSNGAWAERGRAIYAVESRFDIDDLDDEGKDEGLSIFEGFDIAVYNHIFTAPYNGMIVRESSFNRNRIGIITRGMCFQDIVRNTVHVGDETGIPTLDAEAIDREGIVIDGGGFFMLSENEVTGFQLSTTDAATIGIRIRDILTGSEEVYNNTIANCNYANLANGQNNLGQEGVRYVCNHHSGSITDLLVSEFPENDNSASIGPWQSDLGNFLDPEEKSAGNTFSTLPGEFHISNEGIEPINYLFGSGNDEEPALVFGDIIPIITTQANDCGFIVVDMLPEIGNISPTTISNWQAGLAQTKQDWLNSKYLYTLLIDNGNTQELLDEVAYNWTTDVWLTREKIMYSSPYVSSQVLHELADQTTVGFPLAIALEIFMANPNVTNTTSFLKYLDEECNFPKYMQAILASQNNTSAIRAEVEANLARNHMRYLESSVPLIKNLWRKDSTSTDSLVIALGALESMAAEFAIIDLYLRNGDMQAAEDRFAAMEENIILTPEMEEEQITFGKWLDLAMENPKWVDLSNAELGGLSDLALDAYYTTAGKKAAAILNTYYGEDHFIPPYYQGAPGEVRTFLESLKTINTIDFIEVFPNPANDYLNIKLRLEKITITNESITVYDAIGQPLQSLKVSDPNQQLALDLRNYSIGTYTISLQAGEKTLQTKVFNVVR